MIYNLLEKQIIRKDQFILFTFALHVCMPCMTEKIVIENDIVGLQFNQVSYLTDENAATAALTNATG